MMLDTVRRYAADRAASRGERAVVLGGSMAGLCAARVLADAFESVTVLDRDPLPDEPVVRDGVPQSSQPHAMLEAGRATLEDLFPGFCEDLLCAGGLVVDGGSADFKHYEGGDYLANTPERLPFYTATRALFEQVTRQHTADVTGVTLRGNTHFVAYETAGDDDRVTGVQFRDETGAEQSLTADLVVDAMGRTSPTPRWLDSHGYERPPVDEVEIGVTYSSVDVRRPPEDRRTFFAPPSAPRTRGGIIIPAENDRWQVLLQGVHGDDAPTEPDALQAFADSLPVPEIGEILAEREWVSEITHYPFPANVRRRYETVEPFPDGLVVTGDAIASFNPVYGQGMSVAALDALQLHHALADGGLDRLGPRFFDRAADVVEPVWQIATGADFEFDATTGPKPRGVDLLNRYQARLIDTAHDDGDVTAAFYRVLRLECPPTELLRPRIAKRVLLPG